MPGVFSEHVLCVGREDIFPDGAWHGFVDDGLERAQEVIRQQSFFMPRSEVEDDPRYQQITPTWSSGTTRATCSRGASRRQASGGCTSSTRSAWAAT